MGWYEDLAAVAGEKNAFYNRFGLAQPTPWNRPQEYQAGFYNPLQSAFEISQQMALSPAYRTRTGYKAPTDYGDYMNMGWTQQQAAGFQPSQVAGSQAEVALMRLLDMTTAERAQSGLGFQGGTGGEDELNIGYLQNLLQAALRSKFGRYGASAVQSMAGRLAPQYAAMTASAEQGGQPPVSFLDYLKARYGL